MTMKYTLFNTMYTILSYKLYQKNVFNCLKFCIIMYGDHRYLGIFAYLGIGLLLSIWPPTY